MRVRVLTEDPFPQDEEQSLHELQVEYLQGEQLISMLQDVVSSNLGQGTPPFILGISTERYLTLVPAEQVFEQVDQSVHCETLQSSTAG